MDPNPDSLKNKIEKQLILIDLMDNLNSLDYPFLLRLKPNDIEIMKKINAILIKHYKRPWAYVGAEKPYPTKQKLLDEIDKINATQEQKNRLKALVTEITLPIEMEIALNGGDRDEFHNHIFQIQSNQQIEQYLIPENKQASIEILYNGKTYKLQLKGPSVLFIGKANHRREGGECFVLKTPSGNYKKVV